MACSRKDYEAAVQIIRCIPDLSTRSVQASLWAFHFAGDNPRFNQVQFIQAVEAE